MKSKLLNNLGLKILAVLVSIILWMVSVDINDPVEKVSYYNVDVQLVNTHVLTSQNKTYKIKDNTDSVLVRLSAPKSKLSSITRDNITVKADFSEMTDADTVPIKVSINDQYLEKYIESIQVDKEAVILDVEEKKTKQLRIEVVQNGELPDGYMAGKAVTETNMMNISGPESAVNPVARAVVEVSLDSVTSNMEIESQIKLLDANGEEINTSDIKKSIENVKVTIPILLTKEVPIVYSVTGTPESGYALNGVVTSSVETVLIAGKESAIRDITQIEIPADQLDVTDAAQTVVTTVDIRKYLPADVSLGSSDFDGKVTLTAEIEPIRRKSIMFAAETVQLLNLPAGWEVSVVPDQQLKVSISGLQKNLNEVSDATITPHYDLSRLVDADGNVPAGEQEIVINFLLPDTVRQVDPVTLRIVLTPTTGG